MPTSFSASKIGKLDRNKFELIAGGYTAFQLFWAGVRLGLFNQISQKPGSRMEAIQGSLDLESKPARILLTGLVALGLVEKRGDAYFNSEMVEENAIDGKEGSLTPLYEWYARINYPALFDFVDSLKENRNVGLRHFPGSGATLYERLASNSDLQSVFQRAMSVLSRRTNPALLDAFDFGEIKQILDVGGGDGTNTITLARRFPVLHATVFDIPSVCEMAKGKIKQAGLENRIKVHPGNFLKDPFPKGSDGVMFNHILPIWSETRNRDLLRKCHRALPAGGVVFIFNMITKEDEIGPVTPAFGSMYFLTLATGEGMLYTWDDYTAWLKEAGFTRIRRVGNLPLDHGLLIAEKR